MDTYYNLTLKVFPRFALCTSSFFRLRSSKCAKSCTSNIGTKKDWENRRLNNGAQQQQFLQLKGRTNLSGSLPKIYDPLPRPILYDPCLVTGLFLICVHFFARQISWDICLTVNRLWSPRKIHKTLKTKEVDSMLFKKQVLKFAA